MEITKNELLALKPKPPETRESTQEDINTTQAEWVRLRDRFYTDIKGMVKKAAMEGQSYTIFNLLGLIEGYANKLTNLDETQKQVWASSLIPRVFSRIEEQGFEVEIQHGVVKITWG